MGSPLDILNSAALSDVRKNYMPGPDACKTGSEKLPVYISPGKWDRSTPCGNGCDYVKGAIRSMQGTLTEEHIPHNDKKYIDAFGTVMDEYKNYYNNHCAVSTGDPVLDSAVVPGGSGAVPTAIVPGTAGSTPDSGNGAAGTAQTTATSAATLVKSVPKWVLYAGAALLGIVVIVAIAKSKRNVSTS